MCSRFLSNGQPMINTDLLALLRCPKTGERLRFVDSREMPPSARRLDAPVHAAPMDGFLVNESGTWGYPMLGAVPCFLPKAPAQVNDRHSGIKAAQMKQMQKFSSLHDTHYSELTIALHAFLRNHYYQRFVGRSVMDIGNGGLSPAAQYGAEIAKSLTMFVAIDHSYEMLTRKGHFDYQVVADASEVQFADNCVDYVVLNGIIHHLGLKQGEEPSGKIKNFVSRMMRMSRHGVVIMDLLVPASGEWMERIILNFLGEMPTFVYSKRSFLSFLKSDLREVSELRVEPITSLISPFSFVSPLIELSWLRLPAILVPYSFIFLFLKKNHSSAIHPGTISLPDR